MADGYWNQQRQQHHPPGGPMKRPRSDFEAPSSTMTIGHGGGYYPRDEDLDVPDTRTIGSAYDRYLQSVVPFFLASFSVHSSFFIDHR